MSKSLRSYPKHMIPIVVRRRLANPKQKGNGYWAAMDYMYKLGGTISRVLRDKRSEMNETAIERMDAEE